MTVERRFRILAWLLALWIVAPCAQANEELVLGVFPRRSPTETTRFFTPLASHLTEQLGRSVRLVTSRDFDSFWRGVSERRYDIVHYNQYHYIRSADNYQVVAHIEELGKSTIAGAIYVRKDSGITAIAQLRGRTVLFGGGQDAMISYIASRYLMQRAGLNEGDFKSLFAVNPPNSIIGVYHRQADAAGGGDGALELPLLRGAIKPDELVALATTDPLLQLPIAVKRDMTPKLRASIQAVLIALKDSEAGRQVLKSAGMTGMGPAQDKDYEPHRKIVRAVFGPNDLPRRASR